MTTTYPLIYNSSKEAVSFIGCGFNPFTNFVVSNGYRFAHICPFCDPDAVSCSETVSFTALFELPQAG